MKYANYQQWSNQLLQERIQLRQHQGNLLPKLDAIKTAYAKDPLKPLPQIEGFLEAQSPGNYQKAQDNSVRLREADEKTRTAKGQIPKIQAQLKKELNDLQFEYDQLKGQRIALSITLATAFLVIFILWKLQ